MWDNRTPKVAYPPPTMNSGDSACPAFQRYSDHHPAIDALTQIGVTPQAGTTSNAYMHADLAVFDFALSQAQCAQVVTLFETD
jgi:hypothetical protein